MKATPTTLSRMFASLGLVLGLFAGAAAIQAGPLADKLLRKDVDVITVTDVSAAGKSLPDASPDHPVHYLLIYVGEISLGETWGGEAIPPGQETIRWLMAALKTQGYLPADRQHPPQQVLVFGWSAYPARNSLRTAGFLGGGKTNLIWGDYEMGDLSTRLHSPRMVRTHLESKIEAFADSDLFLGIVRSYAVEFLDQPKPTRLWETRFGCPATGLALDETMPLMLKAASLNFGRETVEPVNLNASDAFPGRVTFGEFEVLGEYKTPKSADLPDGARKLATELIKSRL